MTAETRTLDWFAMHDSKLVIERMKDMRRETVKGFDFYLYFSTSSGPYKIIYGYSHKPNMSMIRPTNNTIKARIFYYSCSEASWRAWTGGGWYKGANTLKGYFGEDEEWQGAGYIYECQVHEELSEKLENFYSKEINHYKDDFSPNSDLREKKRTIDSDNEYDSPDIMARFKHFYYNAFTGKPRAGYKHGVMGEYDSERKMIRIIDPTVDYEKSPLIAQFTKKSGADIQRLGAKDKQDLQAQGIWASLLIPCLQNPIGDLPVRSHPMLGDLKFNTKRYRLTAKKNINIDISYLTDAKSVGMRYSGESTTSHCCWISNMHIQDSPITSFGTYRDIPIDLSFIVQKPIDYIKQVSEQYKELMDVAKLPEVGTPQPNRIIKGDHASRSDYVNVCILNETSSPLLREFKSKMRFPLFHVDYSIPESSALLEGNYLRAMAMNGVIEYLTINDPSNAVKNDDKGSHGKKGIKRAKDLMAELERGVDSYQRTMFELFANGRINGASGYDTFGNRINTNDNSLFTCIARNILPVFLSPSICSYDDKPGGGKWKIAEIQGEQGAINRMLAWGTPLPTIP